MLAYLYQPGSFDTLALFDASRERCSLLWVVSASEVDPTERRLLQRTGEVLDVEGMGLDVAAAAIADAGPAGILALADDKLAVAAAIAERTALPFHSSAVVERLVDKHAQRAALRAAGLRAPVSVVLTVQADPAELQGALEAVGTPAVLKPRLGEGSRDTLRIEAAADLHDAMARERAAGTSRDFVLEGYIGDADQPLGGEGFASYVSVESVVSAQGVAHLAVNGRMPPAFPFRETGFFIPAALAPELEREVLDVATAAAVALGIERGCLHTEIKLARDGPTVIEVNGRIGGGVPELLFAVSGVRLLRVAMDVALGALPEFLGAKATTGAVAFLFYVHAPRELSVVHAVDGLDEVRGFEGVTEVVLRRGPGQRVDWREGNHGHVASVFGTVTDHDALRAIYARVLDTIRITGA